MYKLKEGRAILIAAHMPSFSHFQRQTKAHHLPRLSVETEGPRSPESRAADFRRTYIQAWLCP